MYLLKKIGVPLVALLVLSVLVLVFVVLTYEQNGLFMPSFSAPVPAETTAFETNAPENSVNNNFDNIHFLSKEEFLNE